jgi:hypothetical protein
LIAIKKMFFKTSVLKGVGPSVAFTARQTK